MNPSLATRLSPIDLTLVAVYLVAITIFGLRFAKKSTQSGSLKSYFLADNTIPWWAIALSIVSAETSTLTIVSIPGVAFAGDMGFLQVVLGYMLGRIVVSAIFLPKYFKGEMLTAYQLIDRRFGPILHKVTAGLFLATRAAAEGVRVFAISIVVSIAIGTGDTLSIAIISALTLLYTFEGGMAAVIWTDVVQMALYVCGTLVALWSIGHQTQGGWTQIHVIASPLGKFHMLNFAFNLTQSYTFWAGVLGGTFLTMASHGTDQLMVQRMLAARNLRESRLALLSSGAVIFLQFTLFLLIGIGLFVFYGAHAQRFKTNDYIFPTFIVQQMPHGVAGLLVAAILAAAMSNLSAALNSLSSTTVVDFYVPIRRWLASRDSGAPSQSRFSAIGVGTTDASPAEDRVRNLVSRVSTIFWAFVLFAIAVYSIRAGGKGHVVETGLSIASVAYGCLLGVFLLGTLTRYATQWGAIGGMVCGFALNLWLWQGKFPVQIGPLMIPHIAFTWFVLIGSLATFALGSLFSIVLPKPRQALSLLLALSLFGLSFRSEAQESASRPATIAPASQPYDFTTVSTLINDAIVKKQLPGAVVLIGHNNQVVFHHAYGNRALEPTIEPMTEDTIFDMASLTKIVATTTAILQLYEAHKLDLDAPVAKYLPEFAQNGKDKITIRELMTHYSGLPEDVSLKDAWGLAKPERAEGVRRAMKAVPYGPPGVTFKYSDINFITLGALVEKITNPQWSIFADLPTLDIYAAQKIFNPLGMKETRFLSFDKVCGMLTTIPIPWQSQLRMLPGVDSSFEVDCDPRLSWTASNWIDRIAPTAHDDESKDHPELNPDFDHLLRGTVHDPTTRRMGGVAGHAGVFSTAHDMSLFCQALLDKLLHNTGPFPLSQATLRLATSPQAPATAHADATIFTADGQPTKGVAQRGLGWDINSPFSRPRGEIFPIGSFGHTGFTGTSVWLDPASDTYVILLANAIHPRGNPPISALRGLVATEAAKALHLTLRDEQMRQMKMEVKGEYKTWLDPAPSPDDHIDPEMLESGIVRVSYPSTAGAPSSTTASSSAGWGIEPTARPSPYEPAQISTSSAKRITDQEKFRSDWAMRQNAVGKYRQETLSGIDVLESTDFAALKDVAARHNNHLKFALLTNQSGIDAHSKRTIDVLAAETKADPALELTTIFTPEHGLLAKQDTEHLATETDAATHLPIISLYGPKPSDKHPKQSDLKKLDAVVIDLQDAGVRFWTYETVMGYFLEDCAKAHVEVIVLDRPNPIGGVAVQGPLSDAGHESYIDFMSLPVRHGMTFGELAKFFNANASLSGSSTVPGDPDPGSMQIGSGAGASQSGSTIVPPAAKSGLHAALTVIEMQHWQRGEYFADTGLPWTPPSPNMKTPATNLVYPGVALMETTNMSVGRGSPSPYENFGAPFLNAAELAAYLTARNIPGVTFTAATLAIAETPERYPFHGQTIPAIHLTVTDRAALDTPEMGVELLSALHHLYPTQFQLEKARTIMLNAATLEAIKANKDPREIAATWVAALSTFKAQRKQSLLYPE